MRMRKAGRGARGTEMEEEVYERDRDLAVAFHQEEPGIVRARSDIGEGLRK